MSSISRALPWTAAFVLAGSLAVAQPKPQSQAPVPQDPTPVSAPKPQIDKPQPEPRQPAPSGRIGGSELVLSGCLQLADEARPGTTPSGGQSAASTGYLLRGARPAPKDDGPPTTGSPGKDFRIVASSDEVKLADLVGHQVKVKGRVNVQGETPDRTATDAGRSSSQPSGSTGVTTAPPVASSPLVLLTVSSVESVSRSCTVPAS